MDGQQPPPGFYGQPNWAVDCHQENEQVPLESCPELPLSNSHTQTIAAFLENHPTPLLGEHWTQLDDTFQNSGYLFNQDPNMYLNQNIPEQVLYHQSNPCPNLQQSVQMHTSTSTSSLNGVVPPMENWPGQFNYHIEFSKAQDKTKATPWIYSNKLGKLFVSMDKACPINFKLDAPAQLFATCQVRGQVVYSRAEDYQDSVERCINHQQKDLANSQHTAHVLRCDDPNAAYFVHEDKRHSVVVPLKPPAAGTQSVTLCYRFMCLSSCIGSLNRRQTKLIFTLENLNGEVMGRYVCHVRICSCPGRDIRAEEEKMSSEEEKEEGGPTNLIPIQLPSFLKGKTKKRKATLAVPRPHELSLPNEDDNEYFNLNINIRGRQQYELVRDIVERMMRDFDNLPRNANDTSEGGKRFKKEQP